MHANVALLISLLFSFIADAKEFTIRTCISRGATDYAAYLESLKVPNADKRLMQRAAKEVKVKIIFEDSEIQRCFQFAKTGEIDAIYPMTLQKEILPLFYTPPESAQLTMVRWNIYTLTSPTQPGVAKSIKEIKGTIGMSFDYLMAKALIAEGATVDQTAKTPEDLLRQLITRRVTAIIQNNFDYVKASRTFKPAEIARIKMNFTFRQEPTYLLFTKSFADRNPKLVRDFYSALIRQKTTPLYIRESQAMKKALQ